MELIVLGAGGGWAKPGGATSGYLVRDQGFTLWLDAGTGTMANLQEHVGLLGVDAVAISHRHFDHFLDLYPYFLALLWEPERRGRTPLFAPPGFFEHALQLEEDLAEVFDHDVVEPGQDFGVGPFHIRTSLMRHPVPTLGMRIESNGATLAYTADTGPTEDVVALARASDLLLSEATWLKRPGGWDHVHLTAGEAGAQAARAEVPRLLLTHIWPENDPQLAAEQAAVAFDGEVGLAAEGMKVRLGPM